MPRRPLSKEEKFIHYKLTHPVKYGANRVLAYKKASERLNSITPLYQWMPSEMSAAIKLIKNEFERRERNFKWKK